jgi:hypothetical protein
MTTPAPSQSVVFACTDYAGEPHQYRCAPFLAEEGLGIFFRLSTLGAEPLLSAVGSLFGKADSLEALKSRLGSGADLGAFLDLLDGLDFSAVGRGLRATLASPDSPALLRDLVKGCLRDGKPLSDRTNFNEAFTGNYLELLKAAWEVVLLNRFFSLPGTSRSE